MHARPSVAFLSYFLKCDKSCILPEKNICEKSEFFKCNINKRNQNYLHKGLRNSASAREQHAKCFSIFTFRPSTAAMCAAVQPSLLAWFSSEAGRARKWGEAEGSLGSLWQRRRRSTSTCPERTAACRGVQPSFKRKRRQDYKSLLLNPI